MNVTEIAAVAAENGKEPDWGRVMSEIPKVSKWMEKKIHTEHNREHRWGKTMVTIFYLILNPMITVALGDQKRVLRSPWPTILTCLWWAIVGSSWLLAPPHSWLWRPPSIPYPPTPCIGSLPMTEIATLSLRSAWSFCLASTAIGETSILSEIKHFCSEGIQWAVAYLRLRLKKFWGNATVCQNISVAKSHRHQSIPNIIIYNLIFY